MINKALKLALTATILLCFGCQNGDYKLTKNKKNKEFIELFTNIAAGDAKFDTFRKYKLIPMVNNVEVDDKITKLSINYVYQKETDIPLARTLFLGANKELVNAVNATEELKPYFHEDFFTRERACVSIYFVDDDVRFRPDGLTFVSLDHGDIVYCTIQNGKTNILLRESFSEAEAHVQNQN